MGLLKSLLDLINPELMDLQSIVGTVGKEEKTVSSGEPIIISKRCVRCQMFPMPQHMEEFFGQNWRNEIRCTRCRAAVENAADDEQTEYSHSNYHSYPIHPTTGYTGGNVGTRNFSTRRPESTWVGIFPKLVGLRPDQIREWFLQTEARDVLRAKWREMGTMVWVSDGERFWRWTTFPHNMDSFIMWEQFVKENPDWKLLPAKGGLGHVEDTSDPPMCNFVAL